MTRTNAASPSPKQHPQRPIISRIVHMMSCMALMAIVTDKGLSLQQPCPYPTYEYYHEPGISPNHGTIVCALGAPGQAAYHESAKPVPSPVMLHVWTYDIDTILIKCNDGCEKYTLPGQWTVNWTLPPTGSGVQNQGKYGYFISEQGTLLAPAVTGTTVTYSGQNAIYVPPRTLGESEGARVFTITAVIHDLNAELHPGTAYAGLTDLDYEVRLIVTVTRSAAQSSSGSPQATFLSTDIVLDALSDINEQEPDCPPATTPPCCVPGNSQNSQPPDFTTGQLLYARMPDAGMLTNRKLPLNALAKDEDTTRCECVRALPACTDGPMSPDHHLPDTVQYSWSIIDPPNHTAHLEYEQTQSPILVSGDTPETIKVKLTLDDVGASSLLINDQAPPVPTEWIYTIHIYAAHFEGQANGVVHNLEDPGFASTDCLQISYVPTNLPSTADERTYHVRVDSDSQNVPPAGTAVRVRTQRIWPSGEYGSSTLYDHTINCTIAGHSASTTEELRLVSNAQRSTQHGDMLDPPTAQDIYDDSVNDDRSVLVANGDWVTATIRVPGSAGMQDIGNIELPVNRPWNEPASSRSIKVATIEWYSDGSFVPDPAKTGFSSVADAVRYEVRRASEFWAQAGIRLSLAAQPNNMRKFGNTIAVLPVACQASASIIVTCKPDSITSVQQIPVPLIAGDSPTTVAGKICTQVQAWGPQHGYPPWTAEYYLHQNIGGTLSNTVFVTVQRGVEGVVLSCPASQTNGTGTSFVPVPSNLFPMNVGTQVYTFYFAGQLNAIGANTRSTLYRDSAPTGWPQNMAVIQTNAQGLDDPWTRGQTSAALYMGITYPSQSAGSNPGLAYASFLCSYASDAWDNSVPQTLGHELGHLLLNAGDGAHVSGNPAALMTDVPTWDKVGPEIECRLSDTESSAARSLGHYFRPDVWIDIPAPVEQ